MSVFVRERCVNVEVVCLEEIGDIVRVYVRCRRGAMTMFGCPEDCPYYQTRLTDKVSTMLDKATKTFSPWS